MTAHLARSASGRWALGLLIALGHGCVPDGSSGSSGEKRDGALGASFPEVEVEGGRSRGGTRADVFGRTLIGPAQPYEPDPSLFERTEALRTDMVARRQAAWDIVARVVDQTPLLGWSAPDASLATEALEGAALAEQTPAPTVARFETWYGIDDIERMFQGKLFGETLDAEGRTRRTPFTDEQINAAFEWNARAATRSQQWPLERYLRYVAQLDDCNGDPEDCAAQIQSNFSGASMGNARIVYSPGIVRHLFQNYDRLLECMGEIRDLSFDRAAPEENFTFCFRSEFPSDAVVLKAQWRRAELGFENMPVFDTDAATLAQIAGPGAPAEWPGGCDKPGGRCGTRDQVPITDENQVVAIRLRNGNVFRLVGVHIITKELRHWTWITLWWSDRPNEDFGADRPDWTASSPAGRTISPVWSNYKMCVVTDYTEGDADVGDGLPDSLAAALRAMSSSGVEPGPTWCSNPYIEHDAGNARTNCIGCHQHGGSTHGPDLTADGVPDAFPLELVIRDEGDNALFPLNGRKRIRNVFPTDYLWATVRVDDIAHALRHVVDFFDHSAAGTDTPVGRAHRVMRLSGDPDAGREIFRTGECVSCHGEDGRGLPNAGADLIDRVRAGQEVPLALSLIAGRGAMPAWGDQYTDQQIRDLVAFLQNDFGGETSP